MKFLLILVSVFASAFCQQTAPVQATDCGNNSPRGKVSQISVDAPSNARGRILLKKNKSVSLRFDFTPDADYPQLFSSVHGLFLILRQPFQEVDGKSVCPSLKNGANCPLTAHETYTYEQSFFIRPTYPSISLQVEWALIDEDKNPVVCFRLPAEIQ